jgi:predicted RNase H-like HicB family nuclease
VGDTIEETEKNIKDAIEFHLEGMRMAGLAIPRPSAVCEYVEVAAELIA